MDQRKWSSSPEQDNSPDELSALEELCLTSFRELGFDEIQASSFVSGIKDSGGFDSFTAGELSSLISDIADLQRSHVWNSTQRAKLKAILADCRLQGCREIFAKHGEWYTVADEERTEHAKEMLRMSPNAEASVREKVISRLRERANHGKAVESKMNDVMKIRPVFHSTEKREYQAGWFRDPFIEWKEVTETPDDVTRLLVLTEQRISCNGVRFCHRFRGEEGRFLEPLELKWFDLLGSFKITASSYPVVVVIRMNEWFKNIIVLCENFTTNFAENLVPRYDGRLPVVMYFPESVSVVEVSGIMLCIDARTTFVDDVIENESFAPERLGFRRLN